MPDEKPTEKTVTPAEAVFARWLDAGNDPTSIDLEDLCGAHPAHAQALRRIAADWESLHGGLADERPVDETVELGADGDTTDSAWNALIDQLRERGPGHSRYVFEGEIARGGMGVIHRVFDRDARRRLALKVMLGKGPVPAAGDTPEVDDASLGRFLEEAQVTSQLDHPGIVPVHEIGVDANEQVYFTMKLVKGEDLRSVFDRVADPADDDWNTTRALNVMLRVCEAMAYAHDKGVIHRDLKPGNVMVGKFGEAYVMDWGLAKVMGRDDSHDLRLCPDATETLKTARNDADGETPDSPILTMDGAVVGTPAYMPPEQAKGRIDEVGPPADVYAVGAMLYHLLAGRMPYTEPGDRVSARMILLAVTQGPPPSLAGLAPDAPAELAAIVEKAMAREIFDRYPDMTALARDLRAYLENRVVTAYETGAWAALKKWVGRNKALAATAGAAMVAVLALTGWAIAERETAITNEKTATAERDRVLRLSDKRRLDVLLADADQLWPAHPENGEALEEWLNRADLLIEKLPLHEANLAEVRARGTPLPHLREDELATLREHLGQHLAGKEVEGEEFEGEGALAEHVGTLEAANSALDAAIARERDHDFGGDADARWWHDAVRDLVVALHALQTDGVHGPTRASVAQRLIDAETIQRRSIGDHQPEWDQAIAAIIASPKYGGLQIGEQLGLVPIGADRESGLWEFWHVPTGERPSRSEETGALEPTIGSGLVLVLIPGGMYRIGAQKEDEDAPHFDPQAEPDESPVYEVTLSPYFLSKYEMTQGQWSRFVGENPSYYRPKSDVVKTLQHPVEQASWETCGKTLSRLGLVLPTEAQWEAACRARTETPWSTGRERESLEGYVNMADQAAKRAGSTWTGIDDWPELDDGFAVHAPVGSFGANRFGMHDMHGNVWEWCRDWYSDSYEGVTPNEGDGLRNPSGASARACRGGSFGRRASDVRSARRFWDTPLGRDRSLGIRPARVLD